MGPAFTFLVILIIHLQSNDVSEQASVTECTRNTCGQNAHCTIAGGRPECSCFNGYTGDPLTYCRKGECQDNSECRGYLSCINEKCVNPCKGSCGVNAKCEVKNHVPVCSSPGMYGRPV